MKQIKLILFLFLLILENSILAQNLTYPIVDTNVEDFFSSDALISEPFPDGEFYGQDANFSGNMPSYNDNRDSTITDNITGLMWQKYMGDKITYEEAFIKAENLSTAGYTDWRVPGIKELYSLILFNGQVGGQYAIDFFIDTAYFNQPLGDLSIGEREIDAQTWSATQYVGLTMRGDSTVFGVNFIDGRIKGYPKYAPYDQNLSKTMYFRMVRGNPEYGKNTFVDNLDGTISDLATGLMWQQSDDGIFRDWKEALTYAENLVLAEYDDWRLPNAKELQSIVDYSRSPQTTQSPAIDPFFHCTEIDDPNGSPGQYPYYWTGTSHKDGVNPYNSAVYIAFGEAQGLMNENLMDVHGAGAQRSDPKLGKREEYPQFFGPQGDVRYVYNAVRAVRDIDFVDFRDEFIPKKELKSYLYPAEDIIYILNKNDDHWIQMIDIYSITGRLIKHIKTNNQESIEINTTNIPKGIYLVEMILSSSTINTLTFIK